MKKILLGSAVLFLMTACKYETPRVKILGKHVLLRKTTGNETTYDTVTAKIPAFTFINQYGDTVTEKTVAGKIYIVDFFFTHCPSICPKMKAELLRINKQYGKYGDLLILSHSIDPERDSVTTLKNYFDKLGVQNPRWHLLTGNKDSLYAMAEHYLAYAQEDPNAPGGFIHDGSFILIDRHRQIRGYYDGTTDEGTDKLMRDLELLLKE